MKPITVTKIAKDVNVRFSNKEVVLPQEAQQKVDAYWDELIASGKSLTRGEVFTVTRKDVTDDTIDVLVEKTDYAHYIYCQNVERLGEHVVRIIHTASLVETADGYSVFGEMGHQTARAGIHQLCGGGIDADDLRGGYFDFDHNITKELAEELDIDVTDASRVASFGKAYFKEGGPTDKMTVVYKVVLNETKDTFLKKYEQFVTKLAAQNMLPEFERLVSVKNDQSSITSFFAREDIAFDEYMQPLFAYIAQELSDESEA